MRNVRDGLLVFMLLAAIAATQEKPSRLTVVGRDGKQAVFSVEQLRKMPRQVVAVTDPHTNVRHQYEGVPLSSLLSQVGTPSGEALKGDEVRDYVEAAATDNYKAIFTLVELDSMFQDNKVIVADTMDGKPLPSDHGPLQLVVPQDRRHARWVRMLTTVNVRQTP
jgi:DMSO/TMAO reductase YedYZ molybdopterin-dependent catalytic subunit